MRFGGLDAKQGFGSRFRGASTAAPGVVNRHPNPGILVDTTGAGGSGEMTTVSRITTDARYGATSLQASGVVASTTARLRTLPTGTGGVAVNPGQTVHVRHSAKLVSTSGSTPAGLSLSVLWYTAAGAASSTPSTQLQMVNSPSTGVWYDLAGSTVVPADAAFMSLSIAWTGGTNGDTYIAREDAGQIVQGGSVNPPYFDGSLPGASWTGTPGKSASSIPWTSPIPLDNMEGWWGGFASAVADGASVASLSDRSGGNKTATQGTAGNQPVFRAAGINGKPALQFDGVDDSLILPLNVLDSGVSEYSIFTVAQSTALAAQRNLLSLATPANATRMAIFQSAGNFMQVGGRTDAGAFMNGAAVGIGSVPYVWAANGSTAATEMYRDGGGGVRETTGPGAGPFGATQGPVSSNRLGSAINGTGAHWGGMLGDVLLYKRKLTASERQRVENYLGWQYGIVVSSSQPDLHLAASDNTAADGTAVTSWNDRSGNARHVVQANAAKQPVIKSPGFNGQRAIRFDGVDDCLRIPVFGPANTSQVEVLTVSDFAGSADGVIAELSDNTNSGNGRWLLYQQSTGKIAFSSRNSGMFSAPVTFNAYPNPVITRAMGDLSRTSEEARLAINGDFGVSVSYTANGDSNPLQLYTFVNQPLNIGARGDGSSVPYQGDISEVLIWSTAQSAADRDRVAKILATKFGIAL